MKEFEGLYNSNASDIVPVRSPLVRPSHAEVVKLTTHQGKDRFFEAVDAAGGEALVVVHPYFPEEDELYSKSEGYGQYTSDIKGLVTQSAISEVPVLLFEEDRQLEQVDKITKRLGVTDGIIFVVPTKDDDPKPLHEDFGELSQQMKANGLQYIQISGAYLWMDELSKTITPITATLPYTDDYVYELRGCVGFTVEKFEKQGISTKVHTASYPDGGKTILGE